ncbi:MAG: Uncharacterised protein [Gammaproteobacteria bacterium]|nr:MAG: Uncharacterised protein [Gammaproteobacteria bacterium]
MNAVQALQGKPEGLHAGFKALEEHHPNQSPQVDTRPMQILILRIFSHRGFHVVPQSVTGIGQFLAGLWYVFVPSSGTPHIAADLHVEPLIGVLNAIAQGFQFTAREELVIACDFYVGPLAAAQIIFRFGIGELPHGLIAVLSKTIKTQDMATGTANKDVYQEILQAAFPAIDLLKVILKIGRINRQVGDIVLVKEFDLAVHILGGFIARGCGQ